MVNKPTTSPALPSKPTSLELLALNVRILRKMRGLTQEQLAEMAGMERPQVSQLEMGRRAIQLATLDRLAAALGAESWELFRPRDAMGR